MSEGQDRDQNLEALAEQDRAIEHTLQELIALLEARHTNQLGIWITRIRERSGLGPYSPGIEERHVSNEEQRVLEIHQAQDDLAVWVDALNTYINYLLTLTLEGPGAPQRYTIAEHFLLESTLQLESATLTLADTVDSVLRYTNTTSLPPADPPTVPRSFRYYRTEADWHQLRRPLILSYFSLLLPVDPQGLRPSPLVLANLFRGETDSSASDDQSQNPADDSDDSRHSASL